MSFGEIDSHQDDEYMQALRQLYRRRSERHFRYIRETISTFRSVYSYRANLFPECHSVDQLQKYLDGKKVADVGAGHNFWYPSSFLNWCMRHEIDVTGFEPEWDKRSFQKTQKKVFFFMFAFMCEMSGIVLGRKPEFDTPAENSGIATKAENIPMPEGGYDEYIACWSVPRYCFFVDDLKAIVTNASQVISPQGGKARFYPVENAEANAIMHSPAFEECTQDCTVERPWKKLLVLTRNE